MLHIVQMYIEHIKTCELQIHIYLAVVFKSHWVREKHCVGQEMVGLCKNIEFKSKYARCSFVSNIILKAFIHKQALYSSKMRLWHMDEHRTHQRFQCQYCFAHPFPTDQYQTGSQLGTTGKFTQKIVYTNRNWTAFKYILRNYMLFNQQSVYMQCALRLCSIFIHMERKPPPEK